MKETYIVEDSYQNIRLDNYLIVKNPTLSRSHIKKLIESNKVLCNGKTVKAGEKVKEDYKIEIENEDALPLDIAPQDLPIEIIYEDDDMAVVNKPKGMVVHPANGNKTNTLVNALLFKLKNLSSINGVIRPGIVHRLFL